MCEFKVGDKAQLKPNIAFEVRDEVQLIPGAITRHERAHRCHEGTITAIPGADGPESCWVNFGIGPTPNSQHSVPFRFLERKETSHA